MENSYQRLVAWFPLLGKNKKMPYSEHILFLAIHASAKLHNWIMNMEELSYSAEESPKLIFLQYFLFSNNLSFCALKKLIIF